MKALSIQQPWAWAIIHGGKDVENRTWPCGYTGWILVHASKTIDKEGYDWISANENRLVCQLPSIHLLLTGGIIGKVYMHDCVQYSNSPWFGGPFGFVLRDPEPLPFTPCRGRLKLFDVDRSIVQDLQRNRPDDIGPLFQTAPNRARPHQTGLDPTLYGQRDPRCPVCREKDRITNADAKQVPCPVCGNKRG